MSGPSVTRAVAALEEHLGVRLLARTTRAVRTTAVGERFLVDAKQIVLSMTDAEAKARGHHGSLEGPVSVTGSVTFGNMHVAPVVLEFLRAHRR